MFIISLNADYVYNGEFKLTHLLLCILISNFVILFPDYFCLTPKQDEFTMRNSFLGYSVATGIAIISLITMQMLHLTHLNSYALFSLIVLFFLFPLIVDKSRYTDTHKCLQ